MKKTACKNFSVMRIALGLVAGFVIAAGNVQAATVILPNGNRIEGTDIRAQRNGDIILTTPAGQRTFARGTYAKAIADKPAAFDQARALAGQGKQDEAIAMLEKIANDFRYLDWDNNALVAIAQIQGSRNQTKEAVDTFERLLRQSPELRDDSNVQGLYRDALLKAGMYDKLEPVVNQMIAKGSRADAAKAQVIRGDIRMAKGEVEAAAMDYLRSAILFEAEVAVQPEALFKAGEALDRLRDPRAKEMYRKLVQKYPQSSFAQDARSRM
jgi:TolA-binding protein